LSKVSAWVIFSEPLKTALPTNLNAERNVRMTRNAFGLHMARMGIIANYTQTAPSLIGIHALLA